MSNKFRRISQFYNNEESLQHRMITMMVPTIIVLGIVSFILTYSLEMGAIPMLQAASAFIVPIIVAIYGVKTNRYETCYTVICIFLSCILLPSAVFTTGGFTAGMPILCAASMLLCGLCSKRRIRLSLFILALAINTVTYILCITHPEWIIQMDSDRVGTHVFICYVFAGVVMFIVGTMFIRVSELNNRVLSVLRNHMDENVCRALISQEKDFNIGGRCNTAIMFADICSFTSLSESMDTDTLAEFLNTYFEIAYEAVHNNGGVIDKYIGDCVMVFWRDKDEDGEAAVKACKAAMDIKRMLKERCAEINDRFGCDLEFTAGINYGAAYLGDVGSSERKDYTAIGDAVNVASRIQEIAPKGEVYLSEAMAKIVQDKAYITKVPKKVAIRGKCDPMDIYTLVSMEIPEATTFVMDNYHPTGYTLYVCGSRGSYSLAGKRYAEFGGETSCYLFKKDKYALIVDCGSGLQRARSIIADCTDIDIVLTHLHYDHVIGLMDFMIFPKEANLRFYGNFDEWLGDESLSRLFEAPYWPVNLFRGEMISVKTDRDYQISKDIKVRFYPASHPNNSNLAVVHIVDKRVCVMADCENPDDLPFEEVDHCDILIYDGMYEDQYYHEHVGWGHSTWESGVRLAIKAQPKRLVISHHNPRNSDEKLRGLEIKAQADYPATTFAKAGDRFVL